MQQDAVSVRRPMDWVVVGKGIGIVLVVIGHFHPETAPGYWGVLRYLIYAFHMPLFFILSGYLYVHGKYSYGQLVLNKTRRLLYPFLAIAVGFCLIKILIGPLVKLSFPVDARTLSAVIIDPINSYAPMLWFLQALFLIFCAYPLGRSVLNAVALLVLFILINEAIGDRYLFVGRALANMPFFALGVVLRERPRWSKYAIGGGWPRTMLAVGVFAVGCIVQSWGGPSIARDYLLQWGLGAAGSIFIINVGFALAAGRDSWLRKALMSTGYYSMTIYFFHSLFESAVTVGLQRAGHGTVVPFLVVAAASVAAGVFFPMVLERCAIRKWWFTRKFVLGLD